MGVQGRGIRLEADEGPGEHLVVGVPPTLLPGLPGQLDQRLPLVGVDRVELEHVAHVPRGHSHVAGLDATDLGRRALKLVADLVDGQPGGLAEPPQLAGEPPATNRRAVTSHHGLSPQCSTVGRMLVSTAAAVYPVWVSGVFRSWVSSVRVLQLAQWCLLGASCYSSL